MYKLINTLNTLGAGDLVLLLRYHNVIDIQTLARKLAAIGKMDSDTEDRNELSTDQIAFLNAIKASDLQRVREMLINDRHQLLNKVYPATEYPDPPGTEHYFRGIQYRNPLSLAILTGNMDIIKLLANSYMLHDNSSDIIGPLEFATLYKNKDIIRLFIENGIKPPDIGYGVSALEKRATRQFYGEFLAYMDTISYDMNILIEAVQNKDLSRVKELINSGVSVNIISNDETPLSVAINNGDIEMLKYLLTIPGINLDGSGETIPALNNIIINTDKNAQLEIARLLLDAGANLHPPMQVYPLEYFAQEYTTNLKQLVELLLEYGANPYAVNPYTGFSVYDIIGEYNSELLEVLPPRPPPLDVETLDSAVHVAYDYNDPGYLINWLTVHNPLPELINDTMVEFINSKYLHLLKIMLDAGIKPIDNYTQPLDIAVLYNDVPAVTMLLQAGIDPSNIGKFGSSAIHYVTSPEVLQLLINTGVNVNAVDPDGNTLLLKIVLDLEEIEPDDVNNMIRILLANGADQGIANNKGQTAWDLANDDIKVLLTPPPPPTIIRTLRDMLKYRGEGRITVEAADKWLLEYRRKHPIPTYNSPNEARGAFANKRITASELKEILADFAAKARVKEVVADPEPPADPIPEELRDCDSEIDFYTQERYTQADVGEIVKMRFIQPDGIHVQVICVRRQNISGHLDRIAIIRNNDGEEIATALPNIYAAADNSGDTFLQMPIYPILINNTRGDFDAKISANTTLVGLPIGQVRVYNRLAGPAERSVWTLFDIINALYECIDAADTRSFATILKFATDNDKETLLFRLVTEPHNNLFLRTLLDTNLNVNITDSKGDTPLMVATEYDNVDAVRMLHNHGADINAKDANGRPALLRLFMEEGFGADSLVLKYLLENNLDINAIDARGNGIMWYIAFTDHDPDTRDELLDLFIRRGLSANPINNGKSLLEIMLTDLIDKREDSYWSIDSIISILKRTDSLSPVEMELVEKAKTKSARFVELFRKL